ncbi:MAG: nucleotidyltransferase family protein [Candidatus Aenigmatarchaeota archaeon]
MEGRKYNPPSIRTMLDMANFLFESNEDILMALIGGLAVQGLLSNRETRKTSDIDIVVKDKDCAEKLIERYKNSEYQTYYNQDLEKYSIYNWDKGIHIDVYPGKIDAYSFDHEFWNKIVCPEGYSFCHASPEDLIAVKLYAYITSKKGKEKHLIDIYTILLGKAEIDINYLARRVRELSNILGLEYKHILEIIKEKKDNVIVQFKPKEIRMLQEEVSYLIKELEKYLSQ